MKRSIEAQIKINTVIVYLIIVVLFISMFAYIYSFRTNLDEQKRNIELYSAELNAAESLISQVNKTQSDVNLFVATKDSAYKNKFIDNLSHIRLSIDSLKSKSVSSSHEKTLETIDSLLTQKGDIVGQLNKALEEKDLLENINGFLKHYRPNELNSLLTNKQVQRQDTIITKAAPKKNFWKKMGDLFSTKTATDSLNIKSQETEETKTKRLLQHEKDEMARKIKKYVQRASHDYIAQLVGIENRVNDLITADQEISTKISSLLINYYSQIINARFEEIHRSDRLIRQNNNYTLIGGLIALIPIIISLITILHNVNKGKRARQDLENANARIREVMESRHQLLLSISHDIKTPLNSIMGSLDLNKGGGAVNSSSVSSMHNSGKHILSLLDNLLGFSSIEQGRLALQNVPFHLYELCVELQEMFVPLCEKKNLSFETQFNFDPSQVIDADNLKLKQVIINLLSNAVKYTLKGGVKLSVSYSGNNILVLVQDSGVGVAKDKLNKIFEPFVRLEENNSIAEGSGFGMYVVKGLVELFGGTIKADSVVGKGTTFSLVIPADAVPSGNTQRKTKHILLVDDDPALLLTLKSMTLQLGHQAETCQSIDELKKQIASMGKYDLVLTDMEMGVNSGLDSLEYIRKANADIPVILMTARSEINDEQVKLMGFTSCLPKPISSDVLSILLGESDNKTSAAVPEKTEGEVRFYELSQMLGNDKDAIAGVLSAFVENSQKDLASLQKAAKGKDFETAQQKCHKMLSMFMQIDSENQAIDLLKKMDSSRNTAPKSYQGWRADVKSIVKLTEELVEDIKKYLSR
ncbi:MAG: sensory transduction histidine kinase [Bacteroidetes bacterium]|nr:sensory transduction histidine kinase [Bacteroidota bacterium]